MVEISVGMNIPPKVRVFMHRAFNNIVPTLINLKRHHVPTSTVCPVCQLDFDTTFHALIRCDRAYTMWSQAGFGKLIHDFKGADFSDFTLFAYHRLKVNEFEKMCMIAWQIWSDRNALNYGRTVAPVQNQCEKLEAYLAEFQNSKNALKITNSDSANPPGTSRRSFLQAPPSGALLINTGATVNSGEGFISIGAVIRNYRGEVMGSMGKILFGNFSPLFAELLAIRGGLDFAFELGVQVHIVETDSFWSVQAINLQFPYSPVLHVVKDCRLLMARMGNCQIRHTPRRANQVAHELALLVKNSRNDFMLCEEVPSSIVKLVDYDVYHLID